MKLSELKFDYPEDLVATEPQRPSRVLWVENSVPQEISFSEFLQKIPRGDFLIINNTKVLKRRVFAGELEILFLASSDRRIWQVMFPSRKFALGQEIELPGGVRMKLLEKGRPQTVETSQALDESYFEELAELPLPPYVQKARGERHNVQSDESWYQTAWAEKPGSFAAPTASLHFSNRDLADLSARGVQLGEVTLHVGLGTFLPVTTEDLDDHPMHEEFYEISSELWQSLQKAKAAGARIWSLGTTSTRALESAARSGKLTDLTRLLLQPGSEFLVVDRLLTNFHQPESTLLALVYAFAGKDVVRRAYTYAIEKRFRLFSYGDLSAWMK